MAWKTKKKYQDPRGKGYWKNVNEGLLQLCIAANLMLSHPHFGGEKEDFWMFQGSWSGAAASAGTHTGPDAMDISPYNWWNRIKVLRILGMAAWLRRAIKNLWSAHIHAITMGGASNAQYQEDEYLNDQDGLSGSGRDPKDHFRPSVLPILFKLNADLRPRYCKTACHVYEEPAATKHWKPVKADKNRTAVIKVGDKIDNVVAVVRVKGEYWFVTRDGRCGFEDNFSITPPDEAKPTPIPEPKPEPKPVPAPTPKPQPEKADTIWNHAHWNVASAKPGWFPKPWSTRENQIGAELRELRSSIITVNETHYSYMTRDILDGLGEQFEHVSSPIGNDIFFDADKWRRVRKYIEYSLKVNGRCAGVLHLERIETREHLAVVNTHLPNGSPSMRTTAAKNLIKLLRQVDGPILLTGDWNNEAFNSGSPHKQLRDEGVKWMREQAKIVNAHLAEFPKKDKWLSDIGSYPKELQIIGGRLEPTPSTLSDHRPLMTLNRIPA